MNYNSYENPHIEVIELNVEQNFAASGGAHEQSPWSDEIF